MSEKEPSADFDVHREGKRITAKGRFSITALVGVLGILGTAVGAIWNDRGTIYAGIGEDREATAAATRETSSLRHDVGLMQDQITVVKSRTDQDHDAIIRMATQVDWFYKLTGGPLLNKPGG